ncbi:hypothetical protein CH35J_006564 [Colletotrichum higginsianum]|uniref:Uncharacterized protein n=1 Tax=Colletotrichum higginsianum TaxID=80884 RepID=A0A4T0VXY1_9PEZI|nr:hypothetical protein CH35J_006564 [Colletotrichum higginsianum]
MIQEFVVHLSSTILPAPLSIVAWGSRASHELVDPPSWINLASGLLFSIDSCAPLSEADRSSAPSSGPARECTLHMVHLNKELQPLPSAEKLAPPLQLSLYD